MKLSLCLSLIIFALINWCDCSASIDELTRIFEQREGDSRPGGIAVHRLLELDPLPINSPYATVAVCHRYSQELALSARTMTEEQVRTVKRQFWEDVRVKGLSMLHPLCVSVMAECGDVLTASQILGIFDSHPHLVFTNHRLLERIPDYSLFNPEHVSTCFEAPLKSGLNLARMSNLLRSLPPASLIRLIEMTAWDLEDWEMRALYEARGGNLESLLKDFDGHLNCIPFLSKYPWLAIALNNHVNETGLDRLTRIIVAKSHSKEQVFIAIVNAVVHLELFINGQLAIRSNYNIESSNFPDPNEFLKRLLFDKKRLQELIKKEFENDYEFLKLASSPLTRITSESLSFLSSLTEDDSPYTDDLRVSSLGAVIGNWTSLVETYAGELNLLSSSSIGRQLLSMIISLFPEASESEIKSVVDFFSDNRPSNLHNGSVLALRMAWPDSALIQQLESEVFFRDTDCPLLLERTSKPVKNILIEAISFRNDFMETRDQMTRMQDNISAWVSFQMRLQAAEAILNQYDHVHVATKLLPFMLEDEMMSGLIEEFPNILVPQDAVLYLLRSGHDRELLNRFIYNLDDFKQFTGADFQSLQLDFSKIRRGLHTIPPVQLISYLKSQNGMINDPISFIGSLSLKHIWSVELFRKYLKPYIRLPMFIESPELESFLTEVYAPVPSDSLWEMIKWTINCEIIYQEFLVIQLGNRKFDELFLFVTESNHRSKVIESLRSSVSDTEVNAVLKAIQSIPLSQDRLNFFLSSNNRAALLVKKLFPAFSVKTAQSSLRKSLQNFKILIKKLAPSERECDLCLFLLGMCAGELSSTDLDNEGIPIYYKSLLKRRLELMI